MTKTCGECRNFQTICRLVTPSTNASECINFEKKVITNGDKLRQKTNEQFAIDYANYSKTHNLYVARLCPLSKQLWTTMEEAIQANLAYLNAPAESEGEDDTGRN